MDSVISKREIFLTKSHLALQHVYSFQHFAMYLSHYNEQLHKAQMTKNVRRKIVIAGLLPAPCAQPLAARSKFSSPC